MDSLQQHLRSITLGRAMNTSFAYISTMCSRIMDLGIVQPRVVPDISKMNLVFQLSECENITVPLERAAEIWNHPSFNRNNHMRIFITGWRSTINSSNSGPVAKAEACTNSTNFLILDAANFIDTLYTWSALNTDAIGYHLAKALVPLKPRWVRRRVTLVGHSLGAQIASAAGRHYQLLSDGVRISRIVGLDPANPCFYDGSTLPGLRKGDARIVTIIHTNPGGLGTAEATGDGDYFVQGLAPLMPGCSGLDAVVCSHERAVDYWVENLYPGSGFHGRRCERYAHLYTGLQCRFIEDDGVDFGASEGLYFLNVNPNEPYGQNATAGEFVSAGSSCGRCEA
ncbi:CG18258, partial [Drosophila busckii]